MRPLSRRVISFLIFVFQLSRPASFGDPPDRLRRFDGLYLLVRAPARNSLAPGKNFAVEFAALKETVMDEEARASNVATSGVTAVPSDRNGGFVEGEGVTQLLNELGAGDRATLDRLVPLVFDELRRLAQSYLRRERADHTLQPTALVNEAYLRLVNQQDVRWQNRAHFFGIAANLMRQILVDHARRRAADKRGGADLERLSLTHAERVFEREDVDVLALDEALTGLNEFDPQQARIVELKFFAGLTIEETSEFLGVSHATIERDWKLARAWLKRELSR